MQLGKSPSKINELKAIFQISFASTMKGKSCRLVTPVVQSDTDIQTAQ